LTTASTLRLTGLSLWAARVAVAGLGLAVAALLIVGAPARLRQLQAVTEAAATLVGQLQPEEARLMESAGFSVGAYAAYYTAAEVLTSLIALAVAALIFWGRSDDRTALLVAATLMLAVTVLPPVTALETLDPRWAAATLTCRTLFAGVLVPLFFLFPDGRPVPARARWLWPVWGAYVLILLLLPAVRPPVGFGRGLAAEELPVTGWIIVWLGGGVAAQVWRYRRVSTPAQRARTRWVVFGFVTLILCFIFGVALQTLTAVADTGPEFLAPRLIGPTVILAGFAIFAATIGISILRYRLWDIDLIIRRTLVYSTLSGLLALTYLVLIVGLQGIVTALGGARSEWMTVASTLAVAALFAPLRRRLQRFIDRRFFRTKYNAGRTLAAFALTARDETDLHALTDRLRGVVQETMEPDGVSVWIRSVRSQHAQLAKPSPESGSTRLPGL